jgi:hypothetical protein
MSVLICTRWYDHLRLFARENPEEARRLVRKAIRSAGGNKNAAIRQLGTSRTQFFYVLAELGMREEVAALCRQLCKVYGTRTYARGFATAGQPYARR